jgi:hypothetical protein
VDVVTSRHRGDTARGDVIAGMEWLLFVHRDRFTKSIPRVVVL